MHRVIQYVTSPPLIYMIGLACCIGWAVAFLIFHARADRLVDRNNVVIGRDFMAFYVGGRIVANGQAERLYDPILQQKTQDDILMPEKLRGLSYYINPAPVAVVYSVLARVPYLWAFYMHTALMASCFFVGAWILRPHLPSGKSQWLMIALLSASWLPMMHTITGGQNAALSFLLLAAAFSATVRRKQYLAGMALGLLLYKPQYALPLLGLLLLRKEFVTMLTSAVVGAAQYVLGGMFCGWNWPARMAGQLSSYYREAEDQTNSAMHMSFMEVLDYSLIQPVGAETHIGQALRITGFALLGLFVAYLMWQWRHADPKTPEFSLYWALVASATLLISLHTQYYDGALLVLPVLLVLSYLNRTRQPISPAVRLLLILLYLGYLPASYIPEWFDWFRFQPVFLAPLCICLWSARLISRSKGEIAS